MSDGVNPYQTPEAPIASDLEKIRRPPVYTVISVFCWLLGTYHFLAMSGGIYFVAQRIGRLGWRKGLLYLAWPHPKPLLFLTASLLGAVVYFAAGRLLWTRRGRPGLILCAIGIGITYLFVWSLGPI